MKTEILKLDASKKDITQIKKAAEIIRKGGLVAFPTETVYGLGADALNPDACAKIFQVKQRPLYDPLIVHIACKQDIFNIAEEIPRVAFDIIDRFWPGPLTLVLKKSDKIPYIVTGGLDTVAVRMPTHELALLLIKESQTYIAAPSANLFGRPSPTTAQHVLEDLDGKIELIIDGGKTEIGLESTIIDLTQIPFCVLRPGGINFEDLKKIIPDIQFYKGEKVLSPGRFKRHYSPKAKIFLMEANTYEDIEKIKKIASEFAVQGYSVGIMVKEENKDKYNSDFNIKVLGSENNLTLCATRLYSILREFDKEATQVIFAETIKEDYLGRAIMDRLRKASES
ncbi:MAG: L-threonylcarbamoyladenylate synthase [Candidatus Omnitrophica bacterium]|nr:L-threonylcarbamoyladenylate synthase [Candidatus Omnitrophota bacterium]